VGLVLAVVVVAITPFGAPGAAPSSAAADQFSSARAMDHLRIIAGSSRPIGSAGSAVAADYIRQNLESLGLAPHTQTAEVVSPIATRIAGMVHNVVGRLPGTDLARRLAHGHYDSVPTSRVADDGSGVVALLRRHALCARAHRRATTSSSCSPTVKSRIAGAQAFLHDDPWAYAVGVAFDFDSPGSSSPASCTRRAPATACWCASTWRDGPVLVVAHVRGVAPPAHRGDFQLFLARGIPGMSFGMLDGPGYYHTAYDSLASFDEDALQHEGRPRCPWPGSAPWTSGTSIGRTSSTSTSPGDAAVVYGQSLVAPFVALALALFATAAGIAAGRRLLSLRGLALATLGTAATLAASLLVTAVSRGCTRRRTRSASGRGPAW
jgi:hypothetical protein